MKIDYNYLSKKAHENAVKHGWWEKELNNEHCLMMVITEISEAIEADRKDKRADQESFDLLQHNKNIGFEQYIKNTVEDEFADIAIRLFDLAGKLGIDFKKLKPCRYHRVFDHFKFTDNAFGLTKGLCREQISIEKRILFALDFVFGWAKALQIDLEYFVYIKMMYNESRPYKHNKKY